jgi:hypothetical protein
VAGRGACRVGRRRLDVGAAEVVAGGVVDEALLGAGADADGRVAAVAVAVVGVE